MKCLDWEIQEKIIMAPIQGGRAITNLLDKFGYPCGVIARLVKKYREEASQECKAEDQNLNFRMIKSSIMR